MKKIARPKRPKLKNPLAAGKAGMSIHLDEDCVRDLKLLKLRLDLEAGDYAPMFSLPALARHAIRKWCDHVAAPLPRPWEDQTDSEV